VVNTGTPLQSTAPDRPDAEQIVGALASEHRLNVFAAVVLGARTVTDISRLGALDADQVRLALPRLLGASLLQYGPEGLSVQPQVFSDAARQVALARRAAEPTPDDLGATPQQARVLSHFIRDGRLVSLPSKHTKRLRVLEFLASKFVPGMTYTESEVNRTLAEFNDDTAALRRCLVDEAFLDRSDGRYWRVEPRPGSVTTSQPSMPSG
jgi:hypothetical protein